MGLSCGKPHAAEMSQSDDGKRSTPGDGVPDVSPSRRDDVSPVADLFAADVPTAVGSSSSSSPTNGATALQLPDSDKKEVRLSWQQEPSSSLSISTLLVNTDSSTYSPSRGRSVSDSDRSPRQVVEVLDSPPIVIIAPHGEIDSPRRVASMYGSPQPASPEPAVRPRFFPSPDPPSSGSKRRSRSASDGDQKPVSPTLTRRQASRLGRVDSRLFYRSRASAKIFPEAVPDVDLSTDIISTASSNSSSRRSSLSADWDSPSNGLCFKAGSVSSVSSVHLESEDLLLQTPRVHRQLPVPPPLDVGEDRTRERVRPASSNCVLTPAREVAKMHSALSEQVRETLLFGPRPFPATKLRLAGSATGSAGSILAPRCRIERVKSIEDLSRPSSVGSTASWSTARTPCSVRSTSSLTVVELPWSKKISGSAPLLDGPPSMHEVRLRRSLTGSNVVHTSPAESPTGKERVSSVSFALRPTTDLEDRFQVQRARSEPISLAAATADRAALLDSHREDTLAAGVDATGTEADASAESILVGVRQRRSKSTNDRRTVSGVFWARSTFHEESVQDGVTQWISLRTERRLTPML